MEPEFWHTRWARDEIGFHEGRVNRYLEKYWPADISATDNPVFVPLCGKAYDLRWLHDRGYPVHGVELSKAACRAFFEEQGLTPQIHHDNRFIRFTHGDLQLWCGDFFKLVPTDLTGINWVYDRAALIAFPPAMRSDYVTRLNLLLSPGTRMLLVTLDYAEGAINGPPFNVSDAEVFQHFGADYTLVHLQTEILGEDHPFSKRRGLHGATESVFLLEKISSASV